MTTHDGELEEVDTALGRRDRNLAALIKELVLKGYFGALLGPPASGKTTALRIVCRSIAARPGWAAAMVSLRETENKSLSEDDFLIVLLKSIRSELSKSSLAAEAGHAVWSDRLREWLKQWVRQTGKNLLLVVDNLDAAPNALASRLLDELRPLHAELGNQTARVMVVVVSTAPITNLTTGITSPFYNLARTVYTKPLNDDESEAWIKECFSPDVPPASVLHEMLNAARGDATLIRILTRDCQHMASQRGEKPTPGMVKEARSHFLTYGAPDYPRFLEAEKILKAKPLLLAYGIPPLLKGEELHWRNVPLNRSIDQYSLALTGLARRGKTAEQAVVYEVLNDTCQRYLKEKYPDDKLGYRFAATGLWVEAVHTTPKPKNAQEERAFCETSLNAVLVADTLPQAVGIVTRTLETVYDLRQVVFLLRSTALKKMEHIQHRWDAEGPTLADLSLERAEEKDEKNTKPTPELVAVLQQDVQVVAEENHYIVPLVAPRGSVIGILRFTGLPERVASHGIKSERFFAMQNYLSEATGALEQAIKRHKREFLLPEVIGAIARMTSLEEIYAGALRQLAYVIPYDEAEMQVFDGEESIQVERAEAILPASERDEKDFIIWPFASNNITGTIRFFSAEPGHSEGLNQRLVELVINAVAERIDEVNAEQKRSVHDASVNRELSELRLRSSVAAIMARNMSHNIGSHGLSYLSNENFVADEWKGDDKYKEFSRYVAYLNAYLRERMDFIASVPTIAPTWAVGLECVQNIVAPVWGPMEGGKKPRLFLLLDTIARSEDLRAANLRLRVQIKGENTKGGETHIAAPRQITHINYGYTLAENMDGGERELVFGVQTKSPETAHKVAIYMGTTGLQALYGFLENFIRNSAKHSSSPRLTRAKNQTHADLDSLTAWNPDDTLSVTVEFDYDFSLKNDTNDPGWDRNFVRVCVYDNMACDPRREHPEKKINLALDSPLLSRPTISGMDEESGGLWGLKEMKICASFLRGLEITDYDNKPSRNPDVPPILQAVTISTGDAGGSAGDGLGYVFYLPRVKELLVFGETRRFGSADWANLAHEGVYRMPAPDDLEKAEKRGLFNHSVVVVNADENENHLRDWFLRRASAFPVKTLLASRNHGETERLFNAQPAASLSGGLPWSKAAATGDALLRRAAPSPSLIIENKSVTLQGARASEQAILEAKMRWLEHIGDRNGQALPRVSFVAHTNIFRQIDDGADALTRLVQPGDDEDLPDLTGAVVVNHAWEYLKEENAVKDLMHKCRFYAPYRSTPGILRNRLRDLLDDESQLNRCDYRRLNAYVDVMEAALTNVIVIDERIFRESHKRPDLSGNTVLLNHFLRLQNVVVFDAAGKDGQNFLHAVSPDAQTMSETPDDKASVPLDVKSIRIKRGELSKKLASFLPFHFRNQVHFLIIHQTIVQTKMHREENESSEKPLNDLLEALGEEFRPRWLVVTSGRGKPEGEPGKGGLHPAARFLEYSNLRRFTVDAPDKLLLVQTLYALKESRDRRGVSP